MNKGWYYYHIFVILLGCLLYYWGTVVECRYRNIQSYRHRGYLLGHMLYPENPLLKQMHIYIKLLVYLMVQLCLLKSRFIYVNRMSIYIIKRSYLCLLIVSVRVLEDQFINTFCINILQNIYCANIIELYGYQLKPIQYHLKPIQLKTFENVSNENILTALFAI